MSANNKVVMNVKALTAFKWGLQIEPLVVELLRHTYPVRTRSSYVTPLDGALQLISEHEAKV